MKLLLILVLAGLGNLLIAKDTVMKTELATLGGGCFWCVEAAFETLDGVKAVTSGYAGGKIENPGYKAVCSGTTGHAEVVQIEFDPAKVTYAQILDFFWKIHDPTTLNRQGADSGTQYRSTIMYHNEEQKKVAEISRAAEGKTLSTPVVTEIVPLPKFYLAEDYHQDYYRNNPNQGYCQMVIKPKLAKLKK
ncbi:MAG: peptide-methionine (S)-S-oxide reductase MsrA [Verrucomicrobiota bacterium]|nr:peptide-methionine (S)-S-oxide reductase MsrA [Verrucomicrobiota bacterium]